MRKASRSRFQWLKATDPCKCRAEPGISAVHGEIAALSTTGPANLQQGVLIPSNGAATITPLIYTAAKLLHNELINKLIISIHLETCIQLRVNVSICGWSGSFNHRYTRMSNLSLALCRIIDPLMKAPCIPRNQSRIA